MSRFDPQTIMKNKTIGKYKLIEKIGSGGLSDVYKAESPADDRLVAIKIIREELFSDNVAKEVFLREAALLKEINHPNVIKIIEQGQSRGYYYLAMEYIDGTDLHELLAQRGKLDKEQAISIVYQLADALEYMHRHSIIHRDIKPKNILMEKNEKPKISDFGIAVLKQESKEHSHSLRAGTITYMSPEQIKGQSLNEKTDVYSLGITAYEMLTGEVPFRGATVASIQIKHLNFEPLPLRKIDSTLSAAAEETVLRMLEKDPARRCDTATLKKRLSEIMKG